MDMSRRSLMGASAAAAILAACSRPAGGELGALLDRISTDILRESPESCTGLAVTEEQAGGRFMDRLDDSSREGFLRRRAIRETGLADLRRINRESLSAQDAVTYDVVVTSFENNLASTSFAVSSSASYPYVISQLSGSYQGTPDFLVSQHAVTNRELADAYLTRLSAYAGVLDQETARFNEETAAGFIPPDFALLRRDARGQEVGAIGQLRAFMRTAPGENVLVTSFAEKLAQVAEIAESDRTALTQRAQAILTDEVLPAYQRQVDAIVAVLPRATSDAGIWKAPRGEEMYAASLRAQTTTDMTPDEIHQTGLDLIAQLNGEMDAILRAQGMTRGSVAERVRALSRRPDQIYPSTEAGRTQLLADLNAQVQAIKARMPEVCGVLARAELEIKRVPEYTEAGAPGGYYNDPALDGSRPGQYYINLRDPANEWPKFTLPTLTYHEGIPGHHWQGAIQQEAGEMPFIRRALLGFNAYSEGWGLYAEQLADEMGMYANDPFGRVGYLQSAAFRASRLVVDTGMHHMRWTREQAIASMMEATGQDESSTVTEIERYCVWPGQACSYMVGRQALNRMRDAARASLGDRFDIKGFHDTVLTNGATPLSVTERLVQQWAASLQNA
ncbi:MAG: DUF885 family protein [Hyphomonadaceae bacterium]